MARGDSARVPSGTDTRFLLLVMAVLASSIGAFYFAYASIPAKADVMGTTAPCVQSYNREIENVPTSLWFQTNVTGPALGRATACMQPAYQDRTAWISSGIAVECLIAVLLYLLHPWLIIRRRRLRPLATAEAADLIRDLDALAHGMGLHRAPVWMVDPYVGTAGAQAFGLPWRYRVSLDAGLIMRYGVDPPVAQAVVLHELAHIRNRDVGRTYLTIAVWRTFLTVPLTLLIALTVHPGLLSTPTRWEPQRSAERWLIDGGNAVAILALGIVVYLARNGILRTRELYADALAARQPSGQALRAVVGSLPWPPPSTPTWLKRAARVGTHPPPATRLATMDDPTRLARVSPWEFAGVGFTASLATQNFDTLSVALSRSANLASVLGALPAGLLIAGYLALTVWRAVTADPRHRPGRRAWLGALAAMTAGVAAAIPLTLFASIATGPNYLSPAVLGSAMLVLLLGMTALTAWLFSAMTAAAGSGTGARGRRAVSGVAVVTGAALFTIWHWAFYTGSISAATWGAIESPGADIGWYAAVAKATGVVYLPLLYLAQNPLLIPALGSLWLVPFVMVGRRGPRQDEPGIPTGRNPFGRAMLVGSVAALAALLVSTVLPFLAKRLLPESVRLEGDVPAQLITDSGTFNVVQINVHAALFVLAAAVAVAVVTAGSSRLRPALAALTVSTVALIGACGWYLVSTVSSCIDLTGEFGCAVPPIRPHVLGGYVHNQLLRGIIVAVPAVLIGLAVRRRRRRPATAEGPLGRATAVAAGLVAVALAAAAVATASLNISLWLPQPVPAAVANSSDPQKCVVGTWQEEEWANPVPVPQLGTVVFQTSGGRATYGDGVVTYDFTGRRYLPATVNGRRVERAKTGSVTQRYSADYSVIHEYLEPDSQATGLTTTTVHGFDQLVEPNGNFNDVYAYTCLGDTMRQFGLGFDVTYTRVA
ncbi:Zn-dependent protease with chaperone function [Allocatelliglobosispora scoriae]|uniref:Zn-dependent protease with chaperone function n=1 Tax=Allocatelliglobosispora scoriae TaxID=643052 RepID=A0A841BIY1_9ACTN|nr:M48 family metalloprotease [Allocatelliglobosispora scoriae]MBB5867575.1 Zn-dependent protease with chaperone function [Allocatelliglobosispora scoriae]